MERLWQDLKYGVRALAKSPGFTAVAVAALALGIGANTAIFSLVDSIVWRPLPYRNPEQLVNLYTSNPKTGSGRSSSSYGDALDWQEQNQTFQDIAVAATWTFNLTGRELPERILGVRASGNLFTVLGVQPVVGRVFTPEDDVPDGENVAVIGYALWHRSFGGEPGIVDQAVTLNGRPHTIIGVMPPGFHYPATDIELWGTLAGNLSESREGRFMNGVGRLAPDVSLAQAQADMDVIAQRLEQEYPDSNTGWRIHIEPLKETVTGSIRPTLLILLGAVGLVLLIACANVASLLLTRATSRHREIAIRASLGAGRARLVRQLLTESVLLALFGAAVGVFGAYWGVEALKVLSPDNLPRLGEVQVDGRVLVFTFGLSMLTVVFFGLAPSLHTVRLELNEWLREGTRTSATRSGRRSPRTLLVVAEVALTLMLLIGAGLLIRTFARVLDVAPGFNPERLLTMNVFLTGNKYDTVPKQKAFVKAAMEKIQSVPGVEAAAMISSLPFGETSTSLNFQIEGQEVPTGEAPLTNYRAVDPAYFRTMGIPLLEGQHLTERDDEDSPPVLLVNEAMSRRFWQGEDPVGQTIRWVNQGKEAGPHTIVGVVADVKSFGLDSEERPAVYAPYAQRPFFWLRWKTFAIRTGTEPLASVDATRRAILEVDPNLPVYGIASMEELMAEALAGRRFAMLLLSVFAALALILAAVGIYGVMAYAVSQRTREIGVRVALGARRQDILAMILRQGMLLTFLGVCLGLAGAFAMTRYLENLLFQLAPTDPPKFVAVAGLLVAVAALACYLPARRAVKVDPVTALRCE